MVKEEQTKEKILLKPKMRIQLMDSELRVLSDRLVDQQIELNAGPKDKHKDPFRLEVVLTSKNDIELLKSYLDTLAGKLPIKEVASKGRPSTQKQLDSPREDILLEVEKMVSENQNQDSIITYLRDLGFVFILTEDFLHYFPDFPFRKKDIGEPNNNGQYNPKDSFQWMVRRIKMGKQPSADKYDPMIIFGFDVMVDRSKKFVCYLFREFKGHYRADVPGKNALTFANFEMAKMPHYMTEEERLKWSAEMRLLMLNKEKKPSKFFTRWSPEIILPKSHLKSLEHLDLTFKK